MRNLKEQYQNLPKTGARGNFLKRVGKELKKSPHTVRMWFSDNDLTSDMPQDKKTLRVIQKHLNRELKKVTA